MKLNSPMLAFIAIVFLLFPTFTGPPVDEDYLAIVSKSFHAVEGEFHALNIQAWAQINEKGLLLEDLNEIFSQTAELWKITNNPTINNENEEFINLYQYVFLSDATTLEISIQSMLGMGVEGGTFLGIQVISQEEVGAENLYALVEETFNFIGLQTEIGITYIGSFKGFLTNHECKEIIAFAFNSVGARTVEGISTEDLISFSGHTPRCSRYLTVDGKRININGAMRYHTLDDRTYLHMGAPLIFQEY